ncbi:MAG: hypothetical protein CM1200mP30_19180 [Pseudomonadota bacterium]|nr:MAG: hypothetical protein CM1200mP30_19180 [Pseudomonadota bacterium]
MGPPCLVHGDWRKITLFIKLVLFNPAAVIDWEISTLGNPLWVILGPINAMGNASWGETRGLSELDRKSLGIPNNTDYVENYARRVGMTEIPDLTFAVAFSFFRMAAIMQGIKKRVLDGNASNPNGESRA